MQDTPDRLCHLFIQKDYNVEEEERNYEPDTMAIIALENLTETTLLY